MTNLIRLQIHIPNKLSSAVLGHSLEKFLYMLHEHFLQKLNNLKAT